MEILIICGVAFFITRGVARDVADSIAVAKGRSELPSTERWKARNPGKPPEPGVRGYLGRLVSNSVEAWADASSRRYRRKKKWLDDHEKQRTQDYVEKKKAKYTKKRAKLATSAARKEQWAKRRGVIWDKTKNAAAKAKDTVTARRDENKPSGTPHEPINDTAPDAEVLPFPPRPVPTPTEGKEPLMTAPTINPEITNLTEAIAYTRAMSKAMHELKLKTDSRAAEFSATAAAQDVAVAQAELAIASLRRLGVEGQQIAALEAAREQLKVDAIEFRTAAAAMTKAGDAAGVAHRGFVKALNTFGAQTGIAEQIQGAKASGNRAGKREMYEEG